MDEKEGKIFVNSSLITLVLFPTFAALFVYLISLIIQSFTLPLVGTDDGWLSFAGAVIGGTFTIFGVLYTIRKQERLRAFDERTRDNERKEDDRKKYLPVFTSFESLVSELPEGKNTSIYTPILTPKNITVGMRIFIFSLKNSGRSEAYNVEMFLLEQVKIYKVTDKENMELVKSDDYTFREDSSNRFGLIGIGDKLENILLLKQAEFTNQLTEFNFLIKYSDFIGNDYAQKVKLEFRQTSTDHLFLNPILFAEAPKLLKKEK